MQIKTLSDLNARLQKGQLKPGGQFRSYDGYTYVVVRPFPYKSKVPFQVVKLETGDLIGIQEVMFPILLALARLLSYWECSYQDYEELGPDEDGELIRLYGCTHPDNADGVCSLDNKWCGRKAVCSYLDEV